MKPLSTIFLLLVLIFSVQAQEVFKKRLYFPATIEFNDKSETTVLLSYPVHTDAQFVMALDKEGNSIYKFDVRNVNSILYKLGEGQTRLFIKYAMRNQIRKRDDLNWIEFKEAPEQAIIKVLLYIASSKDKHGAYSVINKAGGLNVVAGQFIPFYANTRTERLIYVPYDVELDWFFGEDFLDELAEFRNTHKKNVFGYYKDKELDLLVEMYNQKF